MLRAFYSSAPALEGWATLESSDASAKLSQLLSSPRAWEPAAGGVGGEDGGALHTPACVVGMMRHHRDLVGRLELAEEGGGEEVVATMLERVMMPGLNDLIGAIRLRANVLMLSEHKV